MSSEELRDGIFSLRTRRFGTVAEIMVKKISQFDWGNSISHDLYDQASGKRIEVKFSTALKSNKSTITEDNVLEEIFQAINKNRMFEQKDWNKYQFDCNIQQVKRKEFDFLFFGIFFADKVEIFKIEPQQIDSAINYSDKQHAGNEGEGQFHLNNGTYEYHKNNFFIQALSYDELLEIFE